MPEGYSSLGGQVLLPSDTDKTPAGSSGGSAAATAAGLAALTVGLETSTDTAQLIAPAGVAGVVGLKPTVGRVSRDGRAAGREVAGLAGPDHPDGLRRGRAAAGDRRRGRRRSRDRGRAGAAGLPGRPRADGAERQARGGDRQHDGAVPGRGHRAPGARRDDRRQDGRHAEPEPAEHRHARVQARPERLPGRHAAASGAKSLQEIIDYNTANPVEGLKYQQGQLIAAQAVDLADPATAAAYEADKTAGKASNRALIDAILTNGTADTSDDVDVIVVPSGNAWSAIADRAGYPVLTVPAGYGTGGAGRNPIGVTFVGDGLQRGQAARRRLRLRAGDERAARPELHEPEHVALRDRAARSSPASCATRATGCNG